LLANTPIYHVVTLQDLVCSLPYIRQLVLVPCVFVIIALHHMHALL